jgi:hypothetical protein
MVVWPLLDIRVFTHLVGFTFGSIPSIGKFQPVTVCHQLAALLLTAKCAKEREGGILTTDER